MRFHGVALALLLTAFSAFGDVRLVQPASGARLAGGSVVTIQWDGEKPEHAEEWEAFLSVDGGRYYATRLTPHLDAAIRRFDVRLPNVSSNDVRVLLRFGDEVRESEIESPSRFAIRFDPGAAEVAAIVARNEGEPARPGERGVAVWTSGDRSGNGALLHVRRDPQCGDRSLRAGRLAAGGEGEAGGETLLPPVPSSIAPDVASDRAYAAMPARSRDVLLLVRRLNI